MDVDELGTHLFEEGEGGWCVVDESAAFASGHDFPPHNDAVLLHINVGGLEGVDQRGGEIGKLTFDDTFGCAVFDDFCLGPIALQQSQCAEDDTFARSGLARNHTKARPQVEVEPINQSIVGNVEMSEHGIRF